MRVVLHDLFTMKNYEDLMHICMFMCIGILSLYDEYGRVHYEMEIIIIFLMMLRWSLFSSSVVCREVLHIQSVQTRKSPKRRQL